MQDCVENRNEIMELANKLGRALLESKEYVEMKAAEDAAMKDEAAAAEMGRYLESRNALETLLSTNAPDEEELKRLNAAMEEAQRNMQSIPAIVRMSETERAFQEVIDQMNSIISFIITGKLPENESCTGNCATCHGSCNH